MNKATVLCLMKEGILPDGDVGKTLIETTISWVILGKKYACKIKKPLKLSYLDYSSLSKRKFFCKKELQLNQRLAPHVYLDVLPIGFHQGQYQAPAPPGSKTIDYLLLMRKLRKNLQMDHMLENNLVTSEQIKALAKVVSRFHQRAKQSDATPSLKAMKEIVSDINSVKPFLLNHAGPAIASKIRTAVLASGNYLQQEMEWIKERAKLGFYKECHGDMHAGNVFLYKKPVIFDCIEFNDQFRNRDVLDEVAFLSMDLEAHGKQNLSKIFLSAYLSKNISKQEHRLMVFYKCVNANVRAKVFALQAMEEVETTARKKTLKKSLLYLQCMYRYALQLQ